MNEDQIVDLIKRVKYLEERNKELKKMICRGLNYGD